MPTDILTCGGKTAASLSHRERVGVRGLLCAVFLAITTSFSHAYAAPSHGLAMFGELKHGPDFEHFDYVNPDAPKGGTLKLATIGTFDSLNPFILKGIAAGGVNMIFETLLEKSADEPYAAYGLLAKSVDIAPDRSWVEFTLRPEARWHDGQPITADDVVFSFNILRDKGHPFYQGYYRDVAKVERTSDLSVRFTFANNENRELPFIIGDLPVLPKHYYATHDFEKSTLEPPLGSGPYRIGAVDPGSSITFERVPDHWARDLGVNRGRYNFDRIRFDYYRDETVAVEALKAGEYDARQENISRIWATAYDTPATKSGLLIRREIFHEQPSGMQGFVFNTRRVKLSDLALREAMNLAFDFEWENKVLFYSAYRRTTSYFMNSPFEAKGIPTGAELALLEPYRTQLPARLFTEPFVVPATDGSGNNRANLLKAKAILEAAGWKVKDRLLRIPGTDTPLEIEFLIDSGSFERVISPYINTLARLGITARLRIIDSAQYQRRLDDFDFDVIVNTFGVSLSPGNEQTDFWHSSRVDMPGTKNLAGVKSPVVDALVEKIIRAATYEEMESAAKALDRVLLWGYYVVPNWYNNSFRMIYWDKFGQPAQQAKYALGLTDCWWIDPEKQKRIDAAKASLSSSSTP